MLAGGGITYNAGMSGATSLRDLADGVDVEARAQRLYREDGYGWALEQTDALRRRDVDAIDWENVSEEIDPWERARSASGPRTAVRRSFTS